MSLHIINPTVRERVDAQLRRALGPMLGPLEDPSTIEVMRDPDGSVVVETYRGKHVIGAMSDLQAETLICTVAAIHGQVANEHHPAIEAELRIAGARFTGILPPMAPAPTISIRVPSASGYRLEDYAAHGVMTGGQARILRAAVRQRRNLLIVGATASGKTTLTNTLLAEIEPDERLVILEELSELRRRSHAYTVYLRTTAQYDLTRLVRTTMRLKPDRIVIGEVRGGEALGLLKAWLTGHPGGITTLHANGASAALLRLDSLVQEAGVPSQPRLISEAIDLIVTIAMTPAGRRITEIATINGYDPTTGHRVEPVAG
jgi:P-type conjugative transfer ATPase TrbB